MVAIETLLPLAMSTHSMALLLKQTKGQRKLSSSKIAPSTAVKGELLVAIKEEDREANGHNYFLHRDSAVTLKYTKFDVAPLEGAEPLYLLAVHPPAQRVAEFVHTKKWKWVTGLKAGDEVSFEMREATVNGRILVLGDFFKKRPGIHFGVEITDERFRGQGTTSGAPHFNCGKMNGVWLSIDQLIYKSPQQASSSSSSSSSYTLSKAAKVVASKAKKIVKPRVKGVQGELDELLFKKGDRVVVYSFFDQRPIRATVHWIFPVQTSKVSHVPTVVYAGLETDCKIDSEREFPEDNIGITGVKFEVACGHSRVYLPQHLLVSEVDHTRQEQEKFNEGSKATMSMPDTDTSEQEQLLADTVTIRESANMSGRKSQLQQVYGSLQNYHTQSVENVTDSIGTAAPFRDVDHSHSEVIPDKFKLENSSGYFCSIKDLEVLGDHNPPQSPSSTSSTTQSQTTVSNPLKRFKEYEVEDVLGGSHLFQQYIGDQKGIQGHHNSCYIDSTLFGLFALSDSFDELFLMNEESIPTTEAERRSREAKTILWKRIVNPLRKYGVARYESVMKLRNHLEHLRVMQGASKDEKDPEEFLNILFKQILHVPPFLSIKRPFGVENEFFVQLFFTPDLNQEDLPFTEKLMWRMFHEQNISFTKVPSKLLLQMPRFGKDFKIFNKIFPSLTLDVVPVLDSHMYSQREEPSRSSKMELLSVICIETSHYVCFTRSGDRWLFHDSMADREYDMYNIPRVIEVTDQIQQWVYSGNPQQLLTTPSKDIPEYVRRFTQDGYMCVYINSDVDMYEDSDSLLPVSANADGSTSDRVRNLSCEMESLKRQLRVYSTALKQVQEEKAERERALYKERRSVAQQKVRITQLQEEVSVKSLKIKDVEENHAAAKRTFETTLANKDRALAQQQQTLTQQEEAVAQQQVRITQLQEEAMIKSSKIKDVEENHAAEMGKLKTTLANKDNALTQQQQTLVQQEETMTQQKNQITQLQEEVMVKSTMMKEVEDSHTAEKRRLESSIADQELALTQQQNRITELHNQLSVVSRYQEQVASRAQQKSPMEADISFWLVGRDEVHCTDKEKGSGSWGRVVEGSFRGQNVAVKRLHGAIQSPFYSTLVRREIAMMTKVRHPNLLLFIAAVLENPSEAPIIITELLDTSLRTAYVQYTLSSPVKLSIMRDVAVALNYLHLLKESIIHRDVSSANVLLQALPDNYWRAKLSDFGSANLARYSQTAAPGAEVYAAPEVPRSSASPKVQQFPSLDVYSYGVLLCEVYTEEFPFPEIFPNLLQSLAGAHSQLYQVVTSCVKQDPTKRPSMSNILQQLIM